MSVVGLCLRGEMFTSHPSSSCLVEGNLSLPSLEPLPHMAVSQDNWAALRVFQGPWESALPMACLLCLVSGAAMALGAKKMPANYIT